MSFADVEVQNNVVIAVNVKGRVNQQKSLDLNRRNDVLNLYVNGHWVFQTSGNNAQSAGANDCVMGEYEITRELPSEPILLKRGPSAISVEIITSGSAYHASGYYEIEFVLVPAPNTASTSIVQEVYDIVY